MKINCQQALADYQAERRLEKIIAQSERDYSTYLYRYMSGKELEKILNGETIIGKDFTKKFKTSSIGVCFIKEKTYIYDEAWNPMQMFEVLTGIVSPEYLVCFGVPEQTKITSNWGCYNDPYGHWFDTKGIDIIEYTVPMYSIDTLHPIKVCVPNKWEWKSIEDMM